MAQRTETNVEKFCTFPYREIHLDSQGVFGPCCQYTKRKNKDKYDMSNVSSIKEYLKSPQLENIKKDLEKGIKLEQCRYCWRVEDTGVPSMRQRSSHKDISKIREFFITFGNQCNTACRICNSTRSSLIHKYDMLHADKIEHEQLKKELKTVHPWSEGKVWYTNVANDVVDILDGLEVIKISGGEPFINVHFDRFIDTLVNSGKKLPKIMITTNGSFTIKQLKKLKPFESVILLISCDALGKENYEHLRWPLKWDNFINNINSVFNLDFNVWIEFQIVMHNLNLKHLPDAVNYFKENFSKKSARVSFTTLNGADWYTVANSPKELREKICQELEKIEFEGYKIKPSKQEMIKYIQNAKKQKLSELVSHVKHTDGYRDFDTWKFLNWSPKEIS